MAGPPSRIPLAHAAANGLVRRTELLLARGPLTRAQLGELDRGLAPREGLRACFVQQVPLAEHDQDESFFEGEPPDPGRLGHVEQHPLSGLAL